MISARDYEIIRNQVELGEIIGNGQFGNVHKGSYKGRDNQVIAVAVKTCKVDADSATSEKFLEEACKNVNLSISGIRTSSHLVLNICVSVADIMQQFEHPHIIRLIGLCSEAPI